jgi:hypothetical protein
VSRHTKLICAVVLTKRMTMESLISSSISILVCPFIIFTQQLLHFYVKVPCLITVCSKTLILSASPITVFWFSFLVIRSLYI